MKKTFFNPADVIVKKVNTKPGHLAKIVSRRMFGGSGTGHAAYKTDGGDDAEALMEKIKTMVESKLETRAKKEDIPVISADLLKTFKDLSPLELRAILDDKTGAMAVLASQGVKIQELETRIGQQNKPVDNSIRGQIIQWRSQKIGKTEETVEQRIAKIMEGENLPLPQLELRVAASPMLVSTVNSGGSPYIGRTEVEAGINDIPSYDWTFWDSLTKGRTNAETYVWINKTNRQGAAAFIGPGVAKPGISFELVADKSNAKKIADSAKAGTELLQDIDGMQTFIEQELRWQVMDKVNSTLMDSVGSNTVPTGIKQLSVAFTLNDDAQVIYTKNPTIQDALRAVVAQLRSGKLKGKIDIFINPIDSANMDMTKATDSGVYMLPSFVTADGKTVAGARIIEDSNIPVGTFQAGFMRYYRILIYKDFTVSWGWENDDFTKNLVTAVGEMRLHQFFNEQYTGAFVRDTFENVIDAIEEVVAP